MTDDKLAVVGESRADGCTLIEGNQLLTVLGQFAWATGHPQGVLVVTGKAATARKALEAAGYLVTSADGHEVAAPRADRPRRMPLPLPECANCHAPYRRDHQVRQFEHCIECGAELRLEQHDPNVDLHPSADTVPCRSCRRPVRRHQRFCSCGLPAPTAEQRARRLDGAGGLNLFAMPEGTDQ